VWVVLVASSRHSHPDKQAEDEKIKERYLTVRQAYDILTDSAKRERYDYILDHPLEHYANYARDYAKNMRTNPIYILIGLFLFVNVCDVRGRRFDLYTWRFFVD
jgi:curved DNA-binding protein CbpA